MSTNHCFDLPESVRYDIEFESFDKFDLEEDQITESYDSLLGQNMKLQHDNRECRALIGDLQSKLKRFELKCDSQQQTICALQQQLSIQQNVFDTKFNDLLKCANAYDSKKTHQLSSLNKQYDDLRGEYHKLQEKYHNNYANHNIKNWKWSHIYEWIINTLNDERLNKYRNILYTNLREQNICGATLMSLNDDDLYYLGIKDHNDRQLLINYISKLVSNSNRKHSMDSISLSSASASTVSNVTFDHAHKPLSPQQLKQIRIRQENIVYVVGLPVSLCNAKLLKSEEWFGKFGAISRICFNTSPKCVKANSIPTFVTYTNEIDAQQAITKMNLYCLSDGTRLKTNYGRTKYCPSFCESVACINSKCKFLHQFAKYEDIITEQEINDFNAIRAGPPSRNRARQ